MRQAFTLIELMIVIAIIAIIAAIAIPNLLESRITANEAAAATTLKSGVTPAQISWQAGGYQDSDSDNVGEFATIEYLAGITQGSLGASNIKLITGALAVNHPEFGAAAAILPVVTESSGYNYSAFVPDGDAAAPNYVQEGQDLTDISGAAATNDPEKYWTVACAPTKQNDTGRRVYLITADGQVRSKNTIAFAGDEWVQAADNVSTAATIATGIENAHAGTDLSTTVSTDYPIYTK